MAENLKTTKYRDGSEIPNITNNGEWSGLSSGAYGDYDNNPTNSETYGRLYNWYTVDDERDVCPDGWHVPSDLEYFILTDNLGGGNIAGGKMKESGNLHWQEYTPEVSQQTTNESGYTALPGGYRQFDNGIFNEIEYFGHFWTSSENTNEKAWNLSLSYENSSVYWDSKNKNSGYSVRCIKD